MRWIGGQRGRVAIRSVCGITAAASKDGPFKALTATDIQGAPVARDYASTPEAWKMTGRCFRCRGQRGDFVGRDSALRTPTH
jgi:hypothetical protein